MTSRHSGYLNELVVSRCGPDLLTSGVFPNAKEVTESFGAYSAARRYLKREFPLNDPDVTCICVGDGSTPRTAATFAFRSRWTCWSIDPQMKMFRVRTQNRRSADRITCVKSKIEDFRIACKKAIVVAVHSHASLQASLEAVEADDVAVIAIPCCVDLSLERDPDVTYQDPNILSTANTVRIWRHVESKGGAK